MGSKWRNSISNPWWKGSILIVLLIGLGVILLGHQEIDLKTTWQHMADFGANQPVLFGILIFACLLTLGFVSVIPGGTILIIGAASVINPWVTMAIALVAEALGSFGMFVVASRLFSKGSRPPPKFATRLRQGYEKHPLSYTLLVRIVPFLPPGGVTFALAWLRCPKWIFILAGTLATIPFFYLDISLGAGLGKGMRMLEPSWKTLLLSQQVWLPLGGLALLCLLPIGWQMLKGSFKLKRTS